MSSWMHGQAVRCGPLTQAAQVFGAAQAMGDDPPAGPAGLLLLANAVERHLAQPDTDEERERLFIELAGAYLALLLCEALDAGQHAVQNGKHGLVLPSGVFFDPFAAITRVLRAQQVRSALAQEVARAESRARQARPRPPSWPELRERLLPRLVGPSFSAFVGEHCSGQPLHVVPLAGEVRIAYILRDGRAARYVRNDELEALSVSSAQVQRAALENLARQSADARLIRCESDHGPIVLAKTGDGLDSSRLLLPGLHDVLAAELGSPFAAAVPHRDALFACSLRTAGALADMRERAVSEASRAANRITPRLFSVGPRGELLAL